MDYTKLGWVGVLVGALTLSGCDDEALEGSCGPDLSARVDAVVDASHRLSDSALQMRGDVLAACEGILVDLEGDVPPQDAEETDDEYVQRICTQAAGAIEAEVAAGVTIEVAIQPPQCTVDAQAQLDCEAACAVDGECDPGTIEARCEPGHLSVQCEGSCEVDAYCEAYGDVAVDCYGHCEGECDGVCEGSTNAAGQCDGICDGDCYGSCQVQAEGGIECTGEARCRGGCDGEFTAPECHAELEPPRCDIDAECEAGCAGQASFNAECTEGHIVVVVQGDAHENLATTLEANLPVLLRVGEGLLDIGAQAEDFVLTVTSVSQEVANSTTACIAVASERIVSAAEAAGQAAAAVTVSVEVSVEVSGSATAGAGA